MIMKERTSRDPRTARPAIFDPRTGELTPYGERVAEERHDGRLWGDDDGDRRFDEMGPDCLPDTNVIGI